MSGQGQGVELFLSLAVIVGFIAAGVAVEKRVAQRSAMVKLMVRIAYAAAVVLLIALVCFPNWRRVW